MTELMETLFPMVIAAAMFIGFIVTMFVIMQSAKEAAVLRVLGVGKRRAGCLLALEQIFLCIIGVALATAGIVLINANSFLRIAAIFLKSGAAYLSVCTAAAAIASFIVSNRKILELLQSKE